MAWVKVDDGFPGHHKVYKAASVLKPHGYARVLSMTLQAKCFAARGMTDGFLPIDAVKRFHDTSPLQVAKVLTDVNLWELAEGGYRIHDYLDYNPSATEVKLKRQKDSARKKSPSRLADSERNPESTREGDGSNSGFSEGESQGEPSPVRSLLAHYHDGYLARFHEKPNILGQKDGQILKSLAQTHGAEAVRRRIDALLDSTDAFIAGTGRTIGVLQTCWNKLGATTRTASTGTRPQGCRHVPACLDAAAHTKRDLDERRGVA